MNKYFKLSAIAAGLVASGMAFADTSETKGGIKIKTDDGRFEANVGGRIHFDGNLIHDDNGAFLNTANGSNSTANQANSGFYFRRIYLTLSGKLYGWSYKIENDFAPGNKDGAVSSAFQDVWLGTDIGPGMLQIGQRKPFRAMEDLTSSNEILMIERPFASASGGLLKSGTEREFQDGLFYSGYGDHYTWGTSFTTLRAAQGVGTEGWGSSARGTFAPLNEEGSIIHLGVNISYEKPENNQTANTPMAIGSGSFAYDGRRGATYNLAMTLRPVTTVGVEYANVFGPFFAQAEFYNQNLLSDKAYGGTNALTSSQTVHAYYVQSSVFLTGETKPYKKKDGVFGTPKPNNDFGAVELTARYDSAQNMDINSTNLSTKPTINGSATQFCGVSGADVCKVSAITVGVNYYVNPNVRFMLNYVMGTADSGVKGEDKPHTLAARAQLSF